MRLGHHSSDIYDRLSSIKYESDLAAELALIFPSIPWIPNERAGLWYLSRTKVNVLKGVSVYFKSTDGHVGQWDVNPRRLNLHLLHYVSSNKGLFIIDVTKQGKKFPDSQSKTIPLWCCVMNRLRAKFYPDDDFPDWDIELYLPLNVAVSELEADAIRSRIPAIIENLTVRLFNYFISP